MGANAVGRQVHEVQAAIAELAGWLAGSRDDPGGWPGLDALTAARSRKGRHGAMLLPFRALLAAIEDAQSRRAR
jgi:hypothetical protein